MENDLNKEELIQRAKNIYLEKYDSYNFNADNQIKY